MSDVTWSCLKCSPVTNAEPIRAKSLLYQKMAPRRLPRSSLHLVPECRACWMHSGTPSFAKVGKLSFHSSSDRVDVLFCRLCGRRNHSALTDRQRQAAFIRGSGTEKLTILAHHRASRLKSCRSCNFAESVVRIKHAPPSFAQPWLAIAPQSQASVEQRRPGNSSFQSTPCGSAVAGQEVMSSEAAGL